jgi:hypothetical protein
MCFPRIHRFLYIDTLNTIQILCFPQRYSASQKDILLPKMALCSPLFLADILCFPKNYFGFPHITLFPCTQILVLPTGVFCFPQRPSASSRDTLFPTKSFCFPQRHSASHKTSSFRRNPLLPTATLCFPPNTLLSTLVHDVSNINLQLLPQKMPAVFIHPTATLLCTSTFAASYRHNVANKIHSHTAETKNRDHLGFPQRISLYPSQTLSVFHSNSQ